MNIVFKMAGFLCCRPAKTFGKSADALSDIPPHLQCLPVKTGQSRPSTPETILFAVAAAVGCRNSTAKHLRLLYGNALAFKTGCMNMKNLPILKYGYGIWSAFLKKNKMVFYVQ